MLLDFLVLQNAAAAAAAASGSGLAPIMRLGTPKEFNHVLSHGIPGALSSTNLNKGAFSGAAPHETSAYGSPQSSSRPPSLEEQIATLTAQVTMAWGVHWRPSVFAAMTKPKARREATYRDIVAAVRSFCEQRLMIMGLQDCTEAQQAVNSIVAALKDSMRILLSLMRKRGAPLVQNPTPAVVPTIYDDPKVPTALLEEQQQNQQQQQQQRQQRCGTWRFSFQSQEAFPYQHGKHLRGFCSTSCLMAWQLSPCAFVPRQKQQQRQQQQKQERQQRCGTSEFFFCSQRRPSLIKMENIQGAQAARAAQWPSDHSRAFLFQVRSSSESSSGS